MGVNGKEALVQAMGRQDALLLRLPSCRNPFWPDRRNGDERQADLCDEAGSFRLRIQIRIDSSGQRMPSRMVPVPLALIAQLSRPEQDRWLARVDLSLVPREDLQGMESWGL